MANQRNPLEPTLAEQQRWHGERVEKAKKNGNLVCYKCGLMSGVCRITLRGIDTFDGGRKVRKYVCQHCT